MDNNNLIIAPPYPVPRVVITRVQGIRKKVLVGAILFAMFFFLTAGTQNVSAIINNFQVTPSDTVNLSDSQSRLYHSSSSTSDTVSITAQGAHSVSVVPTDTVTVSDSPTRLYSSKPSISDTVTVSDSPTRLYSSKPSISDTVTVSVSATKIRGAFPVAADTLSLTESIARVHGTFPVASDPISLSDNPARRYGSNLAVADMAAVTESLTPMLSGIASGTHGDVATQPPPSVGSGSGSYPLEIDGNQYSQTQLSQGLGPIPVEAEKQISVAVRLYNNGDSGAISHVGLYTEFDAVDNPAFANTAFAYDVTGNQMLDKTGNVKSWSVTSTRDGSYMLVTFNFTLSKPIGIQDFIIRSWNSFGTSSDIPLPHLLDVTSPPNNATIMQIPEAERQVLPKQAQTTDGIFSGISMWSAETPNQVTDEQLLHSMGISGNKIPDWVVNPAKWVADGKIKEGDFVGLVEYLSHERIIR